MEKIYVEGGQKLSGVIDIQSAKNSVLPILAATILNDGVSIIRNVPDLSDVKYAIEILECLGSKVTKEGKTVIVDASGINKSSISPELMKKMRSSVMFLGPILARTGKADLTFPGGCELGPRPIDLHILALEKLGANFIQEGTKIISTAKNLVGCDIHLSFPSVGATENAMMAACLAKGRTRIYNAAREPEILDLENFLRKIGVEISGAGGSVIEIFGGKYKSTVDHTPIGDRIVASTYLTAAAMTGGELEIKYKDYFSIMAITELLKKSGCDILQKQDSIYLKANGRLKSSELIKTMPYPGFPTDAGAIIMTAMCIAKGSTVFIENIFENRYRHVVELISMGADIKVFNKACLITGVDNLVANKVSCTDLRGGAAMVLAGLVAKGQTEISEISHILRGYEDIDVVLRSLGAKIYIK